MISLGEPPPHTPHNGNGSEREFDSDALRLWFSNTLAHHRHESAEAMKTQLASLEAAVLQHIARLKDELLSSDAETYGWRDTFQVITPGDGGSLLGFSESLQPNRDASAMSVKMSNIDSMAFIQEKVDAVTATSKPHFHGNDQSSVNTEREWEEYQRKIDASLLGKVVSSTTFDLLMAFAIVASAVVMFVELQWYGEKARIALGIDSDSSWDGAVLDLLLIASSSVNLYIFEPLGMKTARSSIFRLLRLTRLLVHETIVDPDVNMDTRLWAYRYYGSSVRSIYTIFEITLAGCWPTYFRPLIEKVSPGYSIVCFLYISAVVFALIRIITALFLKETLRIASADSQSMINEQAKAKKANLNKLALVFKAMDIKNSGKLGVDDFHRVLSHPTVKGLLQGLGMELHDVQMLFRLLDDGDGYVTYEEFVQGVFRLRGVAREIDVVAVLHYEDKIRATLAKMQTKLDQLLETAPRSRKVVSSKVSSHTEERSISRVI